MSDNQIISLKPALFRITCAVIILCVAVVVSFLKRADDFSDHYSVRVVEPTCTENGYSLYTHLDNGEVTIRDVVPAKGHTFSSFALVTAGNLVDCSFYKRVCAVCNFEEIQAEYPLLSISRISLYGSLDGIGKKSSVPMACHLDVKEDNLSLDCYATLKLQGHISLSYNKSNYTLKLFKDEERLEKNKITLSHWNKEHKYILKANYVDATQCRNLVSADIWADMCETRNDLNYELQILSNYGAVDGYPVALYINDVFHGLFTMNLHKDDDLFGMENGSKHAIMICNHGTAPESAFRAEAEFTDSSPWEVEYCGTDDSSWAKDSFNQFIRFVITSDDLVFRKDICKYLDVDAAIDYLIAIYALGLTNHTDQDLVFVSYGGVWIPSLYDMETAFGLSEDGSSSYEPNVLLPTQTNGVWNSGTAHLLWERLLVNFEDQICARYQFLRTNILDPQSLCARVAAFMDGIPSVFYEAEEELNPHPITWKDGKTQILNYIPKRIEILDDIFLKGTN